MCMNGIAGFDSMHTCIYVQIVFIAAGRDNFLNTSAKVRCGQHQTAEAPD